MPRQRHYFFEPLCSASLIQLLRRRATPMPLMAD